jgi:Asp-tRNA(Asn)/Glu-tRNA(Gln) amidotransferase A subunit family amidase
MGSDIGGSIRIPSSFNGIYGYKPSTKRVCLQGSGQLHISMEGYRNLVVTTGPMGNICFLTKTREVC